MKAQAELKGIDNLDDHVDDEIAACLDLSTPRSFFLFAGAGSGKTRSLVTALHHIQKNLTTQLQSKGQRVGVITFTNAACDEIKRRISFDPLIDVRTIHSFSWSLVEGLNRDIREWLKAKLSEDIRQLEFHESKGRKGTKASVTRQSQIESKKRRLENLPRVKKFNYSSMGDNRGRDALSHHEVLELTAHFVKSKNTMQHILVGRYPILLIDESQDTNGDLLDALFAVQAKLKDKFILGLLGDTMQRIYNDGKEGLGSDLPQDWATPEKVLNHRSPRRIITLTNKIRDTSGKQQEPRSDAANGAIRLFILSNRHSQKHSIEQSISKQMALVTGDDDWNIPQRVKTLTLEHRMAANRMGFSNAFSALYSVDSWAQSLLEGTLPPYRFFVEQVLPLVKAKHRNDRFAVAKIIKNFSPLLTSAALRSTENTQAHLQKINIAIDSLLALWRDNADPCLHDILRHINEHDLLEIPESLQASVSDAMARAAASEPTEAEQPDRQSETSKAIEEFLKSPFSQIEPMSEYLSGGARFDTHQGVKGLEFDRVMVIMDDGEAKGFNFKYDNLFGGHASEGKTYENTRRLFYVTTSRSRKSLALVAYSANPDQVRKFVLARGWFDVDEIVGEADLGISCAPQQVKELD